MNLGVIEAIIFWALPFSIVVFEKTLELEKCAHQFSNKHVIAKIAVLLLMAITPVVNIFVAVMYVVIRVCKSDKYKKERK